MAAKKSSCEKSQPTWQSKENLVVFTIGAKATQKRITMLHVTNLLSIGGN